MNLFELGQGVYAFCHSDPSYGDSNIGLVVDTDGLTVVDTTATPQHGQAAMAAIMSLTKDLELPIKRVVYTSSRIPFTGGSSAFWQSAFFGSESTSAALDLPVHTEAVSKLLPNYARIYHQEDFHTRPVTHTITEPAWLTPAARVVPLTGESPNNLVVEVASCNVVFTGAMASFGVTPLAFDGNPDAWVKSLDGLNQPGITIVPGHGQPGGQADLQSLTDYLQACINADGDFNKLTSGPWDDWTDRNFDAVNIERAARLAKGDAAVPNSMLELLGLS